MIYRPVTGVSGQSATDAIFALMVSGLLALILFSGQPYVRLSYDSKDYIAASTSIDTYLNGKNQDGFPYLVRPPVMPLYLHLFDDKILAGALLNILAFAVTVFTCLKLGKLFIPDRLTFWIFVPSVIFSYSFLQFHFFLWTEAAFIAIELVLFYCIITNKPVYQVILLLILAFLLRKAAGFVTLATIAIYLNEKKTMHAVLISIALAIVFIGWEGLVFSQTGSSLSEDTWNHHIAFPRTPHLDSVTSWVLPRIIPVGVRVLIIVVILTSVVYFRRDTFMEYWRDQKTRNLLFFWFTYVASLIFVWGARDFDEADRYLSVTLPFFMLTCFSFFSHFVGTRTNRLGLRFLMILWLIYPVTKCVYHLLTIRF